jgi:hypothetical protein
MASILSAGTTSATALNMSADTTGILQLASNNGTVGLTMDTLQNVGIGTSSPASKLGVAGTITTSEGITYNGASTMTIDQAVNAGAMVLRTGTNSYMRFDTNGSNERMRIDSDGNLLVGITSNVTAGARIRLVYNANAGNIGLSIQATLQNAGTAVQFVNSGGSVCGTITQDTSTTAYNTSSDYRLKHDIQPMTGALAKVAQLKPVTYKWNADDNESQGFIAHELQEVVPECVTGEKDAVDAEGNPQYQGIDTSFLVATLTAAIQELNAKVTLLEEQVLNLGVK